MMTHDLDSDISGYKLLVDFPDFALYADEHDNVVQRFSMDMVAKYGLPDKKFQFSLETMAYLKNYIAQYKVSGEEKGQVLKRFIETQFLKD